MHSFLQVIVKRLVSTIRLQSWVLIGCIHNEIYGNFTTVKDVTPFPDQDIICNDMARAAYRSKVDMSKVYKQIRIVPEHIHKMVFATVLGTFRSQVMQMGDCNAPSTFQ